MRRAMAITLSEKTGDQYERRGRPRKDAPSLPDELAEAVLRADPAPSPEPEPRPRPRDVLVEHPDASELPAVRRAHPVVPPAAAHHPLAVQHAERPHLEGRTLLEQLRRGVGAIRLERLAPELRRRRVGARELCVHVARELLAADRSPVGLGVGELGMERRDVGARVAPRVRLARALVGRVELGGDPRRPARAAAFRQLAAGPGSCRWKWRSRSRSVASRSPPASDSSGEPGSGRAMYTRSYTAQYASRCTSGRTDWSKPSWKARKSRWKSATGCPVTKRETSALIRAVGEVTCRFAPRTIVA